MQETLDVVYLYQIKTREEIMIWRLKTERLGTVESTIDQGYCPVCDQSAQQTGENVIDDDDEIGYECISCEVEYVEVRQTVGYKNLRYI